MGTVLHPPLLAIRTRIRLSFSPLLDGDGVASNAVLLLFLLLFLLFQSPSRWGRCCILSRFSFGMVTMKFQSPSRWGRCCIVIIEEAVAKMKAVSVPFSMGTVLHLRA